jgi:hypothetical protein
MLGSLLLLDSGFFGTHRGVRTSFPFSIGCYLVRQDEHAWYGYPSEAFGSGDPLVWPKGEWEFTDSEDILE